MRVYQGEHYTPKQNSANFTVYKQLSSMHHTYVDKFGDIAYDEEEGSCFDIERTLT